MVIDKQKLELLRKLHASLEQPSATVSLSNAALYLRTNEIEVKKLLGVLEKLNVLRIKDSAGKVIKVTSLRDTSLSIDEFLQSGEFKLSGKSDTNSLDKKIEKLETAIAELKNDFVAVRFERDRALSDIKSLKATGKTIAENIQSNMTPGR